ncbi:uncharacterized protein IUM83_00019 [Phytophthora cinnamomi]|uniref:uncharacterized protein n=1 Tax=Phytophthora cinnamomi TaxID=4785 RepID=UPI00355A85D4|nr:hypothetical protein IUM83_00019 [Phytophthora cinnamomi]
MQQRKRGNESTGESRKLGRRGFDLVEQLAAINGSEWSVAGRRLEKPIALSKRPLQTHSRYISTAPKPLDATTALANGCPLNIQDWIRDHCMEEVARSTTMRKRFAAEKLSNIMSTYYHQVTNRRFMHWRQQALWTQCHRQVRNFCRLKCALAKRDNLARARHVLFKFLRYTQFMRRFGLRVETVSKQRTAAAVLLQNAYRAKQARARFYELKVRLEDQRRQEILTHMWNNAYATTIQKWWRKLRLKLK